jgi:hypothetical protein
MGIWWLLQLRRWQYPWAFSFVPYLCGPCAAFSLCVVEGTGRSMVVVTRELAVEEGMGVGTSHLCVAVVVVVIVVVVS